MCETNIGSPQSIVQTLRNGIFQPEISQIARNRAAGDMNARRRHMTGEGDYVPLAPDDMQTGDIPLDIINGDGVE